MRLSALAIAQIAFYVAFFSYNGMTANLLPISEKRLFEVHSAIFDTFTPFKSDEMDTTITHLLDEAKRESFTNIAHLPNLRMSFFLLDNLHFLLNQLLLKLYYYMVVNDPEEA